MERTDRVLQRVPAWYQRKWPPQRCGGRFCLSDRAAQELSRNAFALSSPARTAAARPGLMAPGRTDPAWSTSFPACRGRLPTREPLGQLEVRPLVELVERDIREPEVLVPGQTVLGIRAGDALVDSARSYASMVGGLRHLRPGVPVNDLADEAFGRIREKSLTEEHRVRVGVHRSFLANRVHEPDDPVRTRRLQQRAIEAEVLHQALAIHASTISSAYTTVTSGRAASICWRYTSGWPNSKPPVSRTLPWAARRTRGSHIDRPAPGRDGRRNGNARRAKVQ